MKCACPDGVRLSHSLILHFVSLKLDVSCWIYSWMFLVSGIVLRYWAKLTHHRFQWLFWVRETWRRPGLREAPCSISFKVTSNTYLHRQIRKRKPLFLLMQLFAAVVDERLPFSAMESSITASQINCHSLMRICSKSDLLMIVLQLRPQWDSCVISFFIWEEDRSVCSWSGVHDWKADTLSFPEIGRMGFSSLPYSFRDCRELVRCDIKKNQILLQIPFRTNYRAVLPPLLLKPLG